MHKVKRENPKNDRGGEKMKSQKLKYQIIKIHGKKYLIKGTLRDRIKWIKWKKMQGRADEILESINSVVWRFWHKNDSKEIISG